jgi:hypothetical protein
MLLTPFIVAALLSADGSTPPARQPFAVLATYTLEGGPEEFGLGSAVDITVDGRGLIYLGGGLHRLDLQTGRDEILVSSGALQKVDITRETTELLATPDDNRVIVVSGGIWNCPWSVHLLTLDPTSVKTLTEEACGEVSTSPSRKRLAVIASETCEGRACGKRRLLIFSLDNGALVASTEVKPDYVDAYWEDDGKISFRYRDRFVPKEQRYEYSSVSFSEAGDRWQWAGSRPSPKPRPRHLEVKADNRLTVRPNTTEQDSTTFSVDQALGPISDNYRSGRPRALWAGDRVIIIRRLTQKGTPDDQPPRWRDQIAVVKLN